MHFVWVSMLGTFCNGFETELNADRIFSLGLRILHHARWHETITVADPVHYFTPAQSQVQRLVICKSRKR